jgi:vacuolar-type H+-ATPase subunit H
MSNLDRPVLNVERVAVQNIKSLASTMRGLLALADTLGDANDLATLFAERKAAVDLLLGQERELKSRVASLDAEVSTTLSDAQGQARLILEGAEAARGESKRLHDEAGRVVREAREQAAQIVEAAKASARDAVVAEVEAIKRKLG